MKWSCHGDIYAKAGWNHHLIVAAVEQLGGKFTAFGPENIGRAKGMTETWQLNGVVNQLNADNFATLGQDHFIRRGPVIQGQMGWRFRGVGLSRYGVIGGADGESEAGAEGVGRTDEIAEIALFRCAFDTDCKISTHVFVFLFFAITRPSAPRDLVTVQPPRL